MSRTGKIVSWVAGILLLLIVIIIVVTAAFDWNLLKPPLDTKVTTELNRPFAIRCDLGADWPANP
ncbi:MAG TPA: hypothetical protein DCM39_12780, partial [Pantoea sp.]|nr:hypothetical protein [Pantoea sp.]